MVGPLLLLLQDPFASGPVLQGELAEDLAEAMDAHIPHGVGRVSQEQQEGVEPGGREMVRSG